MDRLRNSTSFVQRFVTALVAQDVVAFSDILGMMISAQDGVYHDGLSMQWRFIFCHLRPRAMYLDDDEYSNRLIGWTV
nr:hypothetical protein CFP56_53662 [Quercus suber]